MKRFCYNCGTECKSNYYDDGMETGMNHECPKCKAAMNEEDSGEVRFLSPSKIFTKCENCGKELEEGDTMYYWYGCIGTYCSKECAADGCPNASLEEGLAENDL